MIFHSLHSHPTTTYAKPCRPSNLVMNAPNRSELYTLGDNEKLYVLMPFPPRLYLESLAPIMKHALSSWLFFFEQNG